MTDGDQDSKLAALEKALLDESTDPIDIPFSLLKSITGNFSQAQVIDSGGFGAVYKGVLPSGGIVAVKKLYEKLEILDKNFKSEIACLVGVKHKNMVRFLGHCSETQHVMMPYEGKLVCAEERQRLLCFEYLPKGCLADFLSDASCRLQWTTRYEIIKGVCEGVHYLHQQRIIHMDLKPQNILLDDNMVPRIADFGLSRCLSESKSRAITKNMIGTKGYMAPEFINMGEITFKTDIYSLGVIIMEILMGHKERSNVKEVVESWTNKFVTSKSQTALEEVKVCAEIALKCTNYDPGKRLTTCFIIGLFEKLCEVEISNRRDVATSTKGQISFASNVANELKLSLERKRKAATVSVSTGVMSTLGVKLTMAMGDKILSRLPESSSCLHVPGAVGGPKRRMCTGGSSTLPSSSSLGGGGARNFVVGAPLSLMPVTAVANAPVLPVVVVDMQEARIRLVQTLLVCAEALQQENLSSAQALLKQMLLLAASQGGAMRKVAAYFGEALTRRVFGFHPQPDATLTACLHAHFYESCPYLKFAHFTANQAILDAIAGCRRVHVVDFGIKQGMQWPALIQALALRPGGPPSLRLTGVGTPQPYETDAVQQLGWKLAQFAHTIRVDFQYRGLVAATLADLEPYMLMPEGEEDPNEEPEVIAVNSVFEMHRLLAQPGALEKVLGTVHAVRPRVITLVEQEANHNSGSFLDRFTESLHYYSTMFDSLEGACSSPSEVSSGAAAAAAASRDQVMSEMYLGQQICNVVACEGTERTERHETLGLWRNRLGNAGFETMHLGSNAYKQASMLLALFRGGDGYKVEENEGCLTLGSHTRPLIATSAWRLAAP